MSYTETGITVLGTLPCEGGVILRLGSAHADKVLQCYVSGRLAAWQSAPAPEWTCRLSGVRGTDAIFLLAVDCAEARENYWPAAYPQPAAGNRLRVRLPQTIAPYLPTDRWRVYVGDAGAAEATRIAHEAPIYPGGRRACGFGRTFGQGGFGWDGADAAGFGRTFGVGEFGFDCGLLQWAGDPLPPGTYPVAVTVLDAAGNESPPTEFTVAIDTYPRPGRDLTIAGYTRATDTLELSFTPSEDLI